MEEIIVFGKGDYYKFKEKSIKEKYKVICFVDNGNTETRPENCSILRKYRILLMSPKNIFAMTKQLLELGVSEDNIFLPINIRPAFDEFEKVLIDNQTRIRLENEVWHLDINREDIVVTNTSEYKHIADKYIRKNNPFIDILKEMPLVPASRRWGNERGTPIDRYYIEKFLDKNKDCINGTVIEVSENTYTKKFGHSVNESLVIHVDGRNKTLKGNLETGEGIHESMCDCLICTQTVQMIFNQENVFKNIYKMLRAGGKALITAHVSSPISMRDYNLWGEFWRYTPKALERLLKQAGFDDNQIRIYTYGNIKSVVCFMYGLCLEDLSKEELDHKDEQFPLIIGVLAGKGL